MQRGSLVSLTTLAVLAAAGVALPILALTLYITFRNRYKRVGPNEALVIYGRRNKKDKAGSVTREGFRILTGGGDFVKPLIEGFEVLDLSIMTLDISLQGVYTSESIPINVRAVAQTKIGSSDTLITNAAEAFLGESQDDVRDTILQTVAGHLRAIIGTLTAQELYANQQAFQARVREQAHEDLAGMGIEFRSFVFSEIRDDQDYFNALGEPRIAAARRDARIARANAERDADLEEASARRDSETRQIEVRRSLADEGRALQIKEAEIKQEVDVANARAVKAGEMETQVQNIAIAEREAERTRLELDAEVRERAEADKFASQRRAEADRFTAEQEAEAQRHRRVQEAQADREARAQAAEAVQIEGEADAAAHRARAAADAEERRAVGLAEAEAIQARGEAEASARHKLAEALAAYSEAGISLEALKILPEIVAAASEPLSRAGSTTIISNGGDGSSGTGVSKLTSDVAQVLNETLPVVKNLSGIDVVGLLAGMSGPASPTALDHDTTRRQQDLEDLGLDGGPGEDTGEGDTAVSSR